MEVMQHIVWQPGDVAPADRAVLLGQKPLTLWLTGLSGAGKSTLALALGRALHAFGRACHVLDGDNVRHGLSRDLGFSPQDRTEHIRRVAEVARMMNDAGLIVVTALISPQRADRELARHIVGSAAFYEVHVSTPVAVCEDRDPKGLYRRARSGELPEFTGISAPYDTPTAPALVLDTSAVDIDHAVGLLLALIGEHLVRPE